MLPCLEIKADAALMKFAQRGIQRVDCILFVAAIRRTPTFVSSTACNPADVLTVMSVLTAEHASYAAVSCNVNVM